MDAKYCKQHIRKIHKTSTMIRVDTEVEDECSDEVYDNRDLEERSIEIENYYSDYIIQINRRREI